MTKTEDTPGAARLKVVSITCYKMPDYVRSRTVRAALEADPNVELIVIKNSKQGFAKYTEVLRELRRVKREQRPDVYWLNFRGYELLPFVLMIAGRKPVVYDEFVNPVLIVSEHRRNKKGIVKLLMGLWPVFGLLYYWLARRATLILSDTEAGGQFSARASRITAAKFAAFPVGADEALFYPKQTRTAPAVPFRVFFYSPETQPLHGVPVIMEAAVLLKERADIEFLISGHRGGVKQLAADAVARGAHIHHRDWIEFEEFPDVIRSAGVCLGGPFGGTPQSELVVTGKTYQFLACQAPVIIGAGGATSDFTDKQDCLIVPQANPQALADAIAWMADHPAERVQIAAAGRKLFEEKFSSNVIGRAVSSIVRSLTAA